MRRAYLVGAVIAAQAMSGCGDNPGTLVSRQAGGADGREAVVMERNGGATTPFVFDVHVLSGGAKPSEETAVARFVAPLRSDSSAGVTVRWATPYDLRIEYAQARHAGLRPAAAPATGSVFRTHLDSVAFDFPRTRPPGGPRPTQ